MDSLALCNAKINLERAFKNFFRRIGTNTAFGYPRFKNKYGHQSYTTNNVNSNLRIEGNYIILPKIKKVKIIKHREFTGVIKSCSISKTTADKYFAAIPVDTE